MFMARCYPGRWSVCFILMFMAQCHPGRWSVCFIVSKTPLQDFKALKGGDVQ